MDDYGKGRAPTWQEEYDALYQQLKAMVVARDNLKQQVAEAEAANVAMREALETAANRFDDCERETVVTGGTKLRPFKRWATGLRSALTTDAGRATVEELRRWRSLRPEVQAFALAMEERLRANDHKGGWKNETVGYLLQRARQELQELRGAVVGADYGMSNPDAIRHEAADVANCCLMLVDVCGALAALENSPEGER